MPLKLLRVALLVTASLASGCGIGRTATVPASVSGVNYSGNDIHYSLFDPDDPKQLTKAGEDLGPFAAGGVMCCYPVPSIWKPGVKVGVALRVFDNQKLEYLPEKTFIVELPPYDASGKAGDVWFINYPDDSVGVVSTMYRPNAELWPGKIKGWPKPSIEYQREQWQLLMKLALEDLDSDRKQMEELKNDPKKYLDQQWAYYVDYKRNHSPRPKELDMFSNSDDPAFMAYEKDAREKLLEYSKNKVEYLLRLKP